jgi:UDP-2-acetamido-3-amino-2,3-dideoxy-glucuronate N-acetyltransferase
MHRTNESPHTDASENTASPITVAVVGSGYWGKNLTRNFNRLHSLAAVCDENQTVLTATREQYPGVATFRELGKLLEHPSINAIAVATPAETHGRIVRKALEAGKHVFVEKPFVLDETEGRSLMSFAGERGLTIMVGHILQYHTAFLTLKAMVERGELGKLNYIYSHRLNLGKIRREENILWSFAPHDISMILGIAGELPDSVLATGGNYLHEKIADVTTTHLTFPSGLHAHVFVSWLHPFKEQKMVVVGSKRMAVFDDTLPWEQKLAIYPHEIVWNGNLPVPTKADPQYATLDPLEPLLMECSHFLECAATGKTPRTDAREGLRVLRVLNLSQESMDDGSTKRFYDVANHTTR